MSTHRRKIISLLLLAVVAVFAVQAVSRHRLAKARQELSSLLPEIRSITIYDIDCIKHSGVTEAQVTSNTAAPFPLDVFIRAATSATNTGDSSPWKGSSTAIIVLHDGTTRRASFSYYGGFFKLHGTPGQFSVQGGDDSELQTMYLRVLREQIIPKRLAKQRAKGG